MTGIMQGGGCHSRVYLEVPVTAPPIYVLFSYYYGLFGIYIESQPVIGFATSFVW